MIATCYQIAYVSIWCCMLITEVVAGLWSNRWVGLKEEQGCTFKDYSSVALHCSGALTSAELSTLKEKNCLTCSVHPMHSFASPDISVSKFKGTYCAVEGDDEAVNLSIKIFSAIGGITYRIDSDKKTKYHASGVIASNYLVTLCHQAQKCLESTGVEPELAMKIITSLMQGTVDNLSSTLSSKNSLTGPIKRGDVGTVSRHLSAISDSSSLQEFYRQMGLLTLDIANNDPIINSRLVELLDSAKYDQNQTPKPSPAYP